PLEPVMVIAERRHAVSARQLGLRLPSLGYAKVVRPELGRKMGLVVALEERSRLDDVSPVGEALAPPLVVLGYRMKLREVEGHEPHSGIVLEDARRSGLRSPAWLGWCAGRPAAPEQ